MKQVIVILLLSIVVISSCKKDDDESNTLQVKYEVVNLMTVNSHIKITYRKNENTNVVDGPLTAGQKWQLTYAARSGETAYLSGMVVNDSANFDLRIIVDNELFMDYKGYCPNVCDTTEVLISGYLN